MEVHNPALAVAFFYPAGDRESERLWQVVTATPPGSTSTARWQRATVDGATVVQAMLERDEVGEAPAWQELVQEMTRWLGGFWDAPPGHPWGTSRVYIGAAVAGPYQEQRLLQQGLALPAEPANIVAAMPVGRLWLITPPVMAEAGSNVATYAWIHTPADGARGRLEGLLWGEAASWVRAELYLHRALHALRQYGREGRASFWMALDQAEAAAVGALARPDDKQSVENLRRSSRSAMQGLAQLSRRHNLLRSSAFLYRQIFAALCAEETTLFSWYQERLGEALVQWGYDLERADRALALARTTLLALPSPAAPGEPPLLQDAPRKQRPLQGLPAGPLPWAIYLAVAAVIALCLVDSSWTIVLARAGAIVLVTLVLWGWSWLNQRRKK